MRQPEPNERRRKNAQSARDEERVLTRSDRVGIVLQQREDVGTHKGTDLAHGGGDGVVLTTDRGGAGLGRDEADVVTGTELTERQEDTIVAVSMRPDRVVGKKGGSPVDDHEPRDVLRLPQPLVAAGHDETDDGLRGHTDNQTRARSDPIADERTAKRAGDVEQVDDDVPAECLPKRSVRGEDIVEPDGRVRAKGEDAKVVDEPDQGDDQLRQVSLYATSLCAERVMGDSHTKRHQ